MQPYNQDAHANLIALGYEHKHYEADYEDVGDAESGPMLSGHPGFDEYYSDIDLIIIGHDGLFTHHDMRDLEAERFMDGPSSPVVR